MQNFLINIIILLIIIFINLKLFFYDNSILNNYKNLKSSNLMNLTPAEAAQLIMGSKSITARIEATILYLLNNNVLKVSTNPYITKKTKVKRLNYIFDKIKDDNLANEQNFLLNLLLKNNSFNLRDLNLARIDANESFNLMFSEYISILEDSLISKGLKYQNNPYIKISLITIFIALINFLLALIYLNFKFYPGILLLIFTIILIYLSLRLLGLLPEKGYIQYNSFNKLYESLKDLSIMPINEIENKKLILYAISFGIDYETIVKLRKKFNIDEDFIHIYWLKGNDFFDEYFNLALIGRKKSL